MTQTVLHTARRNIHTNIYVTLLKARVETFVEIETFSQVCHIIYDNNF